MIVLPGLFIALLNALIIWRFWGRKIVWWEMVAPVFINLMICVLAKFAAETSLTTDYEFWGGWGVVACHQEPWEEWYEVDVDDYCTRMVTDAKGNMSTESYVCGSHKETRYTTHYEEWWLEDSNKDRINTDASDYAWLVSTQWHNEVREDGHHSNYHRVGFSDSHYRGEGYIHKTRWPGTEVTFVPTTTEHQWTNKVQAAEQSLFHFEKVDEEDIKEFGLYELPQIERHYRMKYVSGDDSPQAQRASQELEKWNAKLGREKQVQMRLLIFRDKPFEAALGQEAHWMGGNKNEFVVCVGVDSKTGSSLWAYVISWTESEGLKTQITDYAGGMRKFDPEKLVNYMVPHVRKGFVRKEFVDFDYLKVKTPRWAYVAGFILSLLCTIGFDVWAVKNEYGS